MIYILFAVCLLMFGCASISQQQITRQPNEVTEVEGMSQPPAGSTILTFSSRYEIPQGSQMRSADVKREKNICEAEFIRFPRAAAIAINLNADIHFRGNRLAGTNKFEIMTTQFPLIPPAYLNGKYTASIQDSKGAEQRYIVTTDPNFNSVTKIEYEVYFQGKLQLTYLCEPEFLGM